MSLLFFALCIGVYLGFGYLLGVMVMEMIDEDVDDYLLSFIIFWPISLMAASVFQLIHFIERMFRGED